MKNILKKSLILLIVLGIICSINNISKAVEINTNLIQSESSENQESDDPYGISTIEADNPTEVKEVKDTETKENFAYFGTDDVSIDEDVYGDTFIFTSGNATINSTLYGNVFVYSKNLTISESGEIKASLFAFSPKINIMGIIDTNIYALSDDFTFDKNAKLSYDLFVSSQNLTINGTVSRNAYCSSENMTLSDDCHINGNLSYSATSEAQINDDVISGDINYTAVSSDENEDKKTTFPQIAFDIMSYIIIVLILFMVYKLFKAKFVTDSKLFVNNIGKCALFGTIIFIAAPILFILTLLIGCLILPSILMKPALTLFVIMLLLYIILLLIACGTTIISLSRYLADKYKDKLKIKETLTTVLFIAVLALIYKLITLVPILGSIITLLLTIFGLGIWAKTILPEKNNE